MGYAEDFPCGHSAQDYGGGYKRRWDGREVFGRPADPVSFAATEEAAFSWLDRLWAGPAGSGEALTMVLVDVDGLDALNRRLDREAGDGVLFVAANRVRHLARRACADHISTSTVASCEVVRLDGDELLAILPGVPASEARRVATDITAGIASGPAVSLGPPGRIEVSRCGCPRHVRFFGPAADGTYLAYEGGARSRLDRDDEVPGATLPGPDVAVGGFLVSGTAGAATGTIGVGNWRDVLAEARACLTLAKRVERAGAVALDTAVPRGPGIRPPSPAGEPGTGGRVSSFRADGSSVGRASRLIPQAWSLGRHNDVVGDTANLLGLPRRRDPAGPDPVRVHPAISGLTVNGSVDPLTGLTTRAGMRAALDELWAGPPGLGVGAVLINVDHMKTLKMVLHHRDGDQVLAVVAERVAFVAHRAARSSPSGLAMSSSPATPAMSSPSSSPASMATMPSAWLPPSSRA